MDPHGHLVPRDPRLIGRNGYRDLNADIDRYVVLPRDLYGALRIGDRATVVLRDGRWQPGRLGMLVLLAEMVKFLSPLELGLGINLFGS
jgi:hypothetical protein